MPSLGGSQYILTFIDDFSCYAWVYFLKRKSDVFGQFKSWEEHIKNCFGAAIKALHTDFGGEYMSTEFSAYLKERGIEHEGSAPHTPEHNRVAERKNRSLLDSARCMLFHSRLGEMFWAEAVHYANIITNCGPTKAVHGMTPHQALFGSIPSILCF